MISNQIHASNIDAEPPAAFAARHGVPAEIMAALPDPSDENDWAAAVYVYQVAKELPTTVPKPKKINFAKIEVAIGNRHEEAWRKNGIEPFVLIPFEDPRFEIGRKIDAEFNHELITSRSFMPAITPTPAGWEGEPPRLEITTLDQLREYLKWRLQFLREFGDRPSGSGLQAIPSVITQIHFDDGRIGLRNALRVFDHLGIIDRPTPWQGDYEGITHHEVECRLSELIRWLKQYSSPAKMHADPMAQSNDSKFTQTMEAQSANPLPVSSGAAQEGASVAKTTDDAYLSAVDLADKFQRDPESTRKKLERWRKTHLEGWHEVHSRRMNEPQFVYRLSEVEHLFKENASGDLSGERPTE